MSEISRKTLRLVKSPSRKTRERGFGEDSSRHIDEKELELKVARYGVGFDVHKHTIVTCIQAQLQNATTVEIANHTFSNSPNGLQELVSFLRKYTPVSHYLMECTGVYHLPLVYILRETFPEEAKKIVPMNPLMVHWRIAELGVKHDKADARDIALLSFYDALLRPSYIGSPHFYNVRDTIRSYHKIQTQLTRLKNRITRRLDSVNQKFPFEFSSEWSIELLDSYFSQTWSLEDAFNGLIKVKKEEGRSIKVLQKHQKELIGVGMIVLPDELRFLLQLDFARFLNEDVAASMLIREAEKQILNDQDLQLFYQQLLDIPGIGSSTAITVLLELGDFHRFSRWQSLVKYCGVIPTVNKSGNSGSKGHVNRFTNKFIRSALSQAASSIVNRCDRSHDLGEFAYRQRRVRKLPYKKVLMKVAQKLARIIYSVLVDGVQYNAHHETMIKRKKLRDNRLQKKHTLLETPKVRALKRNIQKFLISNYEYMNSTSRYHLISGCKRIIRKASSMEGETP